MQKAVSTRYLTLTVLTAAALWYGIFVVHPLSFWVSMSVGILTLVLFSLRGGAPPCRITPGVIAVGILSATVLYAIFFVGNIVSGWIFPFKDAQIASVYSNKAGVNPLLIGALLTLVIGPGEELFWRGFLQRTLQIRLGAPAGFALSALLYAAVHIVTGNFMLVVAALVCGVFWGALYWKTHNLAPVILSHVLWDVTIFLLLPVA